MVRPIPSGMPALSVARSGAASADAFRAERDTCRTIGDSNSSSIRIAPTRSYAAPAAIPQLGGVVRVVFDRCFPRHAVSIDVLQCQRIERLGRDLIEMVSDRSADCSHFGDDTADTRPASAGSRTCLDAGAIDCRRRLRSAQVERKRSIRLTISLARSYEIETGR